ncbi:hypothetical protein [Clostridium sp. UBA3887]|uniref:hypothetical protein n=1 Tax=Clostridium sp. UBA3887 TaxID=1946356 RepID=UPI003217849B
MNYNDIISEIVIFQDGNSINSESEERVWKLLNEIDKLDYESKLKLKKHYINYIYNIYYNLAMYSDFSNAPLKAKSMAYYYILSILDGYNVHYKNDNVIIILEVYMKNSVKKFLMDNDFDEINNVINTKFKIQNKLKLNLCSNKLISKYEDMIKDKEFEYKIGFIIPYPIYIPQNKKYNFCYNMKNYILQFDVIPNSNQFLKSENGFMLYDKDKYGLYNRTRVKVSGTFNIIKLKPNKEINNYDYLVEECISVLNNFIDNIKVTENLYWIERINKYMLSDFYLKIFLGAEQLYSIVYSQYGDSTLVMTQKVEDIYSTSYLNELERNYKCAPKLWQVLFADTRSYYDIGKYKEAIIFINNALENFLETDIREKLEKSIGEQETNKIFNGELDYDKWSFKGEFSEDKFEYFKKINLIYPIKPTTFKIIKNYIDVVKCNLSKNKAGKLIEIIRMGRNDIIHGRANNFDDEELKRISSCSISGFKEFLQLIKN